MRKNIITFTIGAALGATVKIVVDIYKKKHPQEEITGADISEDEEIDEMEEYEPSPNSNISNTNDISEKTDYQKYSSKAESYQGNKEKERAVRNQPKVISPEDYGEIEYYDQIEFMYLADGVLMNEEYETVENPRRLIGDALNHFGEYEEDSVYVQNDRLKTYIAILKDERTSSEIPKMYAH